MPIVYGKYDGRGWTKTLYDGKVVVELYYTRETGFAIDITEFPTDYVCTIPLTEIAFSLMKLTKEDTLIYDSVELP